MRERALDLGVSWKQNVNSYRESWGFSDRMSRVELGTKCLGTMLTFVQVSEFLYGSKGRAKERGI